MWSIKMTLDGNPIPMEMCQCESPEKVAAVILALCNARETRPITVERIPDAQC